MSWRASCIVSSMPVADGPARTRNILTSKWGGKTSKNNAANLNSGANQNQNNAVNQTNAENRNQHSATVNQIRNNADHQNNVKDSPETRGSEPTLRHSKENDAPENQQLRRRKLTAYERVSFDLTNDQRCIKEVSLGKRIGFYRFRGDLGSGNFSQVKVATHVLTREKVAIKILDKTRLDQKTQRLLSREISNMERLHHPNVIRLYEVVETLTKLYIVMEYANGGELFHKIQSSGKLAEPEAAHLYAQIISAVKHIHENNIVHRDIKAENVFFYGANQQVVKLGDFGFSTSSLSTEKLNTFCGSPPYAAPELFKDESYLGRYVDVWALGVLLFFMVTGQMPFRADTVGKLKRIILEGSYVIPSYTSDSCQFVIRNILKQIPSDRLMLDQIMMSDWMTGNEFPHPHSPYDLQPNFAKPNAREEEKEVHTALKNFGITDDHVKEAHLKTSRSSVTGTYRIMLHRAQKKNTELLPETDDDDDGSGGEEDKTARKITRAEKQLPKKSKLCTLL